MTDTFSTILMLVLALLLSGVSFYMVFKLYSEKGIGHALLGFFIPFYAYIWGWLNAKRLQMMDVMAFWTAIGVIFIGYYAFFTVQQAMLIREAITSGEFSAVYDDGSSLTMGEAMAMGSIDVGGQANGRVDNLFALHDWTFNGRAGQVVTIRANAANGDETDPRLKLFSPGGALLTEDDDGGNNRNALISNYTLPDSGQYTIQLDVFRTGAYEITLD